MYLYRHSGSVRLRSLTSGGKANEYGAERPQRHHVVRDTRSSAVWALARKTPARMSSGRLDAACHTCKHKNKMLANITHLHKQHCNTNWAWLLHPTVLSQVSLLMVHIDHSPAILNKFSSMPHNPTSYTYNQNSSNRSDQWSPILTMSMNC